MEVVGNRKRNLTLTLTLNLPLPTSSTTFPHFLSLPPPASSDFEKLESSTTPPDVFHISDFEKLEFLGRGNGGSVYKVRHLTTSAVYALKFLHSHNHYNDPFFNRDISREITVARRASNSPFVVRCHSVLSSSGGATAIEPSSPALLLEYLDAGTLGSLLRRHRRLPETALPEITRQILLGLSYLHSQNIVHRDIKPSNLLLNSGAQIKISDFGASRVMTRSLDPCNSYVGTCAYMSPERFDPETHGYDGYAADVWSLGLTIMELYLGHFPLVLQGRSFNWASLWWAICYGDPPSLPDSASEELRGFVECCLQKAPEKRLTVGELLDHPFVARDLTESRAVFMELLAPDSGVGACNGSGVVSRRH